MTPRQRVEQECDRRGKPAVVRGCIALLDGAEADDDLIIAFGGPAALGVLDGREGGRAGYWPRVWAARGLLHAWDDEASAAVVRAGSDDSWRVREMVAKIAAKHQVDGALELMLSLRDDPVPRVRATAQRAIKNLTESAAPGAGYPQDGAD